MLRDKRLAEQSRPQAAPSVVDETNPGLPPIQHQPVGAGTPAGACGEFVLRAFERICESAGPLGGCPHCFFPRHDRLAESGEDFRPRLSPKCVLKCKRNKRGVRLLSGELSESVLKPER